MLIHRFVKRALGFGLLCTGLFAGCKKDTPSSSTDQKPPGYYGRQAFILPLTANLIVYDSAMKLVGLIDTLAMPGPYTIFAPDNNIMQNYSWGVASNGQIVWVSLPPYARNTLLSMMFRGAFHLDSLPAVTNQMWMALSGIPAYISKYISQGDTIYTINGAPVYRADFSSTNGTIQILDNQLPVIQSYPTITAYVNSAPELTYLAVALQRSGLCKLLSDTTAAWTLLAPGNSAFQNSPDPSLNSLDSLLLADTAKLANLIRFHLLPGRRFISDFNFIDNAFANAGNGGTDSIRLATLNGTSIDYINQNGTPYFYGSGDSALQYDYNTGTYVNGPNPIGLYSPSYGAYTYDQPVGNGVVQELSGLLLP